MAERVVFRGSEAETVALLSALTAHCQCVRWPYTNRPREVCPSHRALAEDQRFNDGLLYVRRRLATHAPGACNRVVRAPDSEGNG